MKKAAFTLIELLVVIAIIAILAAILFPVFAQAKLAAKKISALSNVKQVSLAVIMYENDSDDVYPQGAGACWWQPLDGGWQLDTQPYIKSYPLLLDPSDDKGETTWPSWLQPSNGGLNVSFVANGYIVTNTENALHGVMGIDQAQPTNRCGAGAWMSRGVTNSTAVTKPADTIMLSTRYQSNDLWGPSNLISGGMVGWDGSGFAQNIPDATRNGQPYVLSGFWNSPASGATSYTANLDNRNGGVSAFYAGKTNFTFSDGHAKTLDPRSTDPDPVNQPLNNMWDAYR